MATKDDGVRLCAECKALPEVEDLRHFPDMCARCGTLLMPAREAAFADWLNAALLAAIPDDGTPITRDDATGGRVFNRMGIPSGVTTGDCFRALFRLSNAGVIEWCGEGMKSIRRRVKRAPVDDGTEDDIERARRGPVPVETVAPTLDATERAGLEAALDWARASDNGGPTGALAATMLRALRTVRESRGEVVE